MLELFHRDVVEVNERAFATLPRKLKLIDQLRHVFARCLEQLRGRLREPVALDHFESFELTQDYPFGVATAVGARSWFLYGLDPAPHGRTGRRSPAQQRRLRSPFEQDAAPQQSVGHDNGQDSRNHSGNGDNTLAHGKISQERTTACPRTNRTRTRIL